MAELNREVLKTYDEWYKLGKVVVTGMKAEHYLVSPEGDRGIALFHEEQTGDRYEPDLTHWHRIVPREEWKTPKEKPKPRIRVRPHGTGLAVWCGNNRTCIKLLQKKGWHFERAVNRWVHTGRNLEQFVPAMEGQGFEVIVDG